MGEKKTKKGDAAPKADLEVVLTNELSPPAEYIDHRIQMFDILKQEYDNEIAGIASLNQPNQE